jgi:hypothetical protein
MELVQLLAENNLPKARLKRLKPRLQLAESSDSQKKKENGDLKQAQRSSVTLLPVIAFFNYPPAVNLPAVVCFFPSSFLVSKVGNQRYGNNCRQY